MSNIPFKVKLLTSTAKAPERADEGDLFDLFVDDFSSENLEDMINADNEDIRSSQYRHVAIKEGDFEITKYLNINHYIFEDICRLFPGGRILIKTGIAIELAKLIDHHGRHNDEWSFNYTTLYSEYHSIKAFAVADIRPRSGLALKHGITVLNSPGTIDNSYRKEIGVILYNAGHEPYTIKKGDKIAQMLIRPLYPSSFEVVEEFEDTGRGGFGSTGK